MGSLGREKEGVYFLEFYIHYRSLVFRFSHFNSGRRRSVIFLSGQGGRDLNSKCIEIGIELTYKQQRSLVRVLINIVLFPPNKSRI